VLSGDYISDNEQATRNMHEGVGAVQPPIMSNKMQMSNNG